MSTYWRPSIPGSLLATFTTTRRANNDQNMNGSRTVNANKSPSSEGGEDTSGGSQQREDIILTPASTARSEESEGETNGGHDTGEKSTRPTEGNAKMGELKIDSSNDHRDNISEEENWGQYTPSRNDRELREEVRSSNKVIPKLKGLFTRSSSSVGEEAEYLSRVKANHRSSLASLAESHRAEIVNLTVALRDEIKKLEEAHAEEMRNVRKGNGFDNELVRGLHKSYGKQIESLVLDLSEAKRQLKMKTTGSISSSAFSPIETRSSVSSFPDEVPAVPGVPARRLPMILSFGDLDKAFSVAEISIPHPGPSFETVYKHLRHAVQNHLQTLNAATVLFAPGVKGESEAKKIRHWYQSAVEERIHFTIQDQNGGGGIKDLWRTELWKSDDFVLRVDCTAEGPWSKVPIYDEGFAEQRRMSISRSSDRPSSLGSQPRTSLRSQSRISLGLTSEQLVEVEGETSRGFDATAELERINRELGELDLHDSLRLNEDHDNKENVNYSASKRYVTVEDVADEDDPARAIGEEEGDEGVGLAISSSPTPPPQGAKEPLMPSVWTDNDTFGSKMGSGSRATSGQSFISTLLDNGVGTGKKGKQPAGGSNTDSWLFDELFSPLSSEKKKGKEKITESSDEYSQDQDERSNGNKSSQPWRWMLTPDGTVITPPPHFGQNNQAPMTGIQGFERTSAPRLERLNEGGTDDGDIVSGLDQPDIEQEDFKTERRRHKLFSFGEEDATSPAPPPAPEPSTRKSPTLPAYLRAEIESSYQSTRMDDDSDIDDNQPREADPEAAFSELKPGQCDTPVMGTSRSAASSTPLLRDGSPAPRRGTGPSLRLDTDNFRAPRGLDEPFAPMPKAPNPSTSTKAPKYRCGGGSYGYPGPSREQEGGVLGEPWESASEVSTAGGWENRHGKRCGHGKGLGTYTWRRDLEESEDFQSRSISPQIPPPSRSSMTTTDRSADFILPPQTYQQNIGSSSGSNGPIRYGGMRCMGPLGPAHMQNYAGAHQADLMFHQQLKNAKELFAAGYRGSGPPPFMSPMGPVYAPNPPHSVSAFGSGAQGRSSAFLVGNNEQRVTSENGGNWPMRPPPAMHPQHNPQFGPHMWNLAGEGPRRSYSTDSISPLMWKLDTEGGLQQTANGIPGPMMPPQRPGSTIADQTTYQNQLNASWMSALANGYAQQPSTPGSHGSAVGQMPGPQWFLNMQQAQAQAQAQAQLQGNPGMPFDAWAGSPMGGIPGKWAVGPFSS